MCVDASHHVVDAGRGSNQPESVGEALMGHAGVSLCDVQEAQQRSVPVLVQKHQHAEGLLQCGIASPTSCLGVGECRVDGLSQGVQYEPARMEFIPVAKLMGR